MSDVTIAVLTAGVSDPSSTRLLADRAAQRTADALAASDLSATFRSIDLSTIAVDIAQALVSGMPSRKVAAAIEDLAESDAIIASTPVYKAGISGLFKSFADLLDNDLLIAKPVLLAATGGT
ncbi:MAG TPA: NAD(P)H-dependent oxidoreductase, partial [Nocardioides sp.]